MKKFILTLIVLISFFIPGKNFSQFNPDSLETRINRIVKKYVDTNQAGMVVGIIRKEGSAPILSRRYSYGHVRRDTNSPRPDSTTIFHIGSVTKSFTATILSMLIQDGGPLNLNDLVEDHIPPGIVKAPYYVSPGGDTIKMSIIDLATHYSALPDDPINPVNDTTTYQMMYHYLNNHRLTRTPGQCYLYSNLGVSFLGVVITHTLGNIIDTLFIQKISNPLGMPDTRITLNAQQELRRATGYVNGDSVGYFKNSWPAFYAAGGLYTTLKDFMKYLEFNMGLSNPGMKNILDSAHLTRRITNDTCANPQATGRIGLVWQMNILNEQIDPDFYFTWKDGGVPGFVSFICFADDKSKSLKTGVVMIANQSIACDALAKDILKYLNSDTTLGIKQTSEIIPADFILHQNYPNPFNPVTNLEFGISEFGFVTLKVYDSFGKEVAVLVNENKHPGNYKIKWNASDFPSGVYFYKLSYGTFAETRKMFLIK